MQDRLAIGAVQFGMSYGVANRVGQISQGQAKKIVLAAQSSGIGLYDTAPCYGNSEQVLGQILPSQSQVMTKTHIVASEQVQASDLKACECVFQASLNALGRASIYGVMVHATEDLNKVGSDRLYAWLCELKTRGLVEKIGVSVYTPEQVDWVTERYAVDLVQFPLSVMDQRMKAQGRLAKLKALGIELHVRSVFLQGLLLMGRAELPAYFAPYRDAIIFLHEQAQACVMTPLQLCLSFVMSLPEIDRVIVGVQTLTQLSEILQAVKRPLAPSLKKVDFQACCDHRSGLIHPAVWPACVF